MVVGSDKTKMLFQHLLDSGRVHSQQDLANAIGRDKGYVSRQLNNERGASADFVRMVCAAFPGIFNLNYFLSGEGEMLVQRAPSAAMQSRSDAERVDELLRQNSALIAMMADYKQELQAIKESLQKLERARYGYDYQPVIAADGGI